MAMVHHEHRAAAGFEDAMNFAHDVRDARRVMNHAMGEHDVEARVWKRERLGAHLVDPFVAQSEQLAAKADAVDAFFGEINTSV